MNRLHEILARVSAEIAVERLVTAQGQSISRAAAQRGRHEPHSRLVRGVVDRYDVDRPHMTTLHRLIAEVEPEQWVP